MSTSMAKNRCRLSVAMIVRNEADVLAETINSIRAIADQIVVVDTGSHDTTPLVAGKHGAQVISCEWTDDFSAPRNRAWRELRGDWVLWLDAGERIDADTAEAIRRYVTGAPDANKAFLLFIEVPPQTPDGAAERVGRVRLVPNRPGLEFTGRIRESLKPALETAGITLEIGPWTIHRSAREHQAEIKRRRAQRDVRLIELEMNRLGRQPHLLCALGDVCANTGRRQQARELFRAAIAESARGSTEMLEGYYGLLASYDDEPAQREAQLTSCLEALEIFPFDAQLLCAMGSYLQAQDRADLACRSYEAAFQFGQINPETWHLVNISELSARCLSLNLQLAGEEAKAVEVLENAIQRQPASAKLRRQLIDLFIRQADARQALAQLDELSDDSPQREALRSAVRGACQAAKENWIPALAYLETAYAAGCRDPLCLRWMAACLVATGKRADAEPVVREWHRQEPRHPELKRYFEELGLEFPSPAHAEPAAPSAQASRPVESTAAHTASTESSQSPAEPPPSAAAIIHSGDDTQRLRVDSARRPLDAEVHLELGQSYRRQGDDDAAETVWSDFLERAPRSPQVARALCELYAGQDRAVEAMELLATCLAPEAERPWSQFIAGLSAAKRGDWHAARRRLQRSRDAGYDADALWEQLAKSQAALGYHSEAESSLRMLLKRNPAHSSARDDLARMLRQSGRSGEALAIQEAPPRQPPSRPHVGRIAPMTAGSKHS